MVISTAWSGCLSGLSSSSSESGSSKEERRLGIATPPSRSAFFATCSTSCGNLGWSSIDPNLVFGRGTSSSKWWEESDHVLSRTPDAPQTVAPNVPWSGLNRRSRNFGQIPRRAAARSGGGNGRCNAYRANRRVKVSVDAFLTYTLRIVSVSTLEGGIKEYEPIWAVRA